jgi:hypothetical protein
MKGTWEFRGCDKGIVWDAHHFDLFEEGLICKWSGTDERGRASERTEYFAGDGTRIRVEESTTEWKRSGLVG